MYGWFPIEASIYMGFPIAMFEYPRVSIVKNKMNWKLQVLLPISQNVTWIASTTKPDCCRTGLMVENTLPPHAHGVYPPVTKHGNGKWIIHS